MVNGSNRVPVFLSALLFCLADVSSAQELELPRAPNLSVVEGTQVNAGVPSLLGEALRSVVVTRYCPTVANEESGGWAPERSVTRERCVSLAVKERPRDISPPSSGSRRDHRGIYTPDWEGFRRDIVMQGAVNLNVLGILFIMPESATTWTTEQKRDGLGSYWANVSKGPYFDRDPWVTNYMTHPLAGSGYFVTARRRGLGWRGALFYSSLVSTFGWEMGVEALFEQPSVQDLLVTPVVGTILGESMLRLHQRFFERRVGSRVPGMILMGVIDPTGSLSRWVDGTGVDFFVSPEGFTLSW